ncbi:Pilin/Flagellin, FlaG/FlaF family [Halapricum desulfuricans]|uniref:Pilin/Flagellin, FlaG/FlaF family n=1 Tax=Halapricum desulfuricans TaxID=2841257 RepID=A0A897NDV9_9EURY|nr:type IV pilin [Halapricum desulfuricans]QSG10571.1 Pilin/Flagellin, FlaG/FlaF family [Halapricum desulfuricans]
MDRAVAPVVSTILLVAIAVILAATVSMFVFDFGEEVEETAPVVGQSSGDFDAFDSGSDEQIVTVRHVAGDDIPVEEMEVAVSATCTDGTKRGRLVDLPVDGQYGHAIGDNNIEGADIFSQKPEYFAESWDLGTLNGESFTAGDKIEFRIKKSDDSVGCTVPQDGTVTVRVIHIPTNAVVIEQELTAE